MRTLVLHIGDHKTGSTTIQHAFARGQVLIDGAAPFYGAALNHNHLVPLFKAILAEPQGPKGQKAHRQLSKLTEGMASAASRDCVISAEEFEGFPPQGLRDLIERYFGGMFDRIRVVAYVRPHLQRVLSEYAERTKLGFFTGDLDAFFELCVARKLFFYQPRFQRWRAVFGEDFVLRPFLRDVLLNESPLDDVVTAAWGQRTYRIEATGSQNESLSLEDLLRVKFLQAQIAARPRPFHHSYGWAMARVLGNIPQTGQATRIRMHRALAQRVGKRYAADARQLDKAFFGGEPYLEQALRADMQAACKTPQPTSAEELFPASELRSLRLAAELIAEMLGNGRTPWPEHFHKRRLDELHDRPDLSSQRPLP